MTRTDASTPTSTDQPATDQLAADLTAAHPRVIDLVARGARLNPDGVALVHLPTPDHPGTDPVTHDRMMGLVAAAAARFRALGVGPTDAVAILLPSCPALMVSLWAAMWAGVAQPLNLLFTRDAIAGQLKAAKAKLLIVPPEGAPAGLYEKVAGLEAEIPGLRILTAPIDGSVALDGEALKPDPDWRARLDQGRVSADPDRVAALYPTAAPPARPSSPG